MRTVVVIMSVSKAPPGFLERVTPTGAAWIQPDPTVKRHRDQHLADEVRRFLADGRDVVVEAPGHKTQRAVIGAARSLDARVVGYWARRPKARAPWIFEVRREYHQVGRRPRPEDGFDVLYEVVTVDEGYQLREL